MFLKIFGTCRRNALRNLAGFPDFEDPNRDLPKPNNANRYKTHDCVNCNICIQSFDR